MASRLRQPAAGPIIRARAIIDAPGRAHARAMTRVAPGWLGVLACTLAGLGTAAASPLEDPTLGGAVFTGPVHAHATAIYENPAALGMSSRGAHIYLGGSLRLDGYDVRPRLLASDPGALQDGPRVRGSTMAPGTTLALYSVGERVALGAGMSWVVLDRFIEEKAALGHHTLGGIHRQYVLRDMSLLGQWDLPFEVPLPMLSLAASYRWRDFYFGVGVSLRASSLALSFLRDTALERGRDGIDQPCGQAPGPCGIGNPAAAERYDLDVSTSELFTTRNLVLNGGVMWRVAPAWWLGVHYQSPPGFLSSLSLAGKAQVKPAPYLDDEPAAFTADAELIYRLPQTLSVGVRGPALDDIDFIAAARWQNLSRHRLLDIRLLGGATVPEWMTRYRGFADTFTFTAGLEQRPGRRLRLGGRLQLETGTTPAGAVAPLQVEGLNITTAAGGELRLLNGVVLYASYGLTYYPTVTTGLDSHFDPRLQLACVDSGYALETCTPAAEGRAVPTAAGTYERIRHGFRAAIRYDFR